jgi:aminoglycoside phosphotransferase (APT) family kinase protein
MGGETPEGIERGPVEAWFAANVEGSAPPLEFDLISGGKSNLTYGVTDSAGKRWALRRPPLGKVLGNAHDMSREVKVIAALQGSSVPVPTLAGFSEDDSVNGAPFYVMDFLSGPILRTGKEAAEFPESERRAIGERVVDTLVDLHRVDPDEVGLGDLGRKEDYVQRQLKRWQRQWEGSKTREVPLVEEVHDRLVERVPDQGPATIVHGDYRLDNMILTDSGEIAAVVDWELCTLGDPLADVGLLAVYWGDPDQEILPGVDPPTATPGFPDREEVVALYGERSGRDISQIDFYVALGLWKLAVIAEGIVSRFKGGAYGESDGFAEFEKVVERVAEEASNAVDRLDA